MGASASGPPHCLRHFALCRAIGRSMHMRMAALLVEQRRIGDEFRLAEKAIEKEQAVLAGRGIDAASRTQMEAGAPSRVAELMRLGQRMLELDASVSAAAARARLSRRRSPVAPIS